MHPLHHLSTFFLTRRCRKNPLNIAERCFIPLLGVPLFFKYKIKALLPSHQSQTARFTSVKKNGRFLLWNFVDDEFQNRNCFDIKWSHKSDSKRLNLNRPIPSMFFYIFSPGICRNISTSIVWATRVFAQLWSFLSPRFFFRFHSWDSMRPPSAEPLLWAMAAHLPGTKPTQLWGFVWVRLCCTSFCFRFASCYLFLVQVRVVFICLFLKATIMPFIFLVLLLLLLFLLVLLLLLRSYFCFCWLLLISSSSSSSSSIILIPSLPTASTMTKTTTTTTRTMIMIILLLIKSIIQ